MTSRQDSPRSSSRSCRGDMILLEDTRNQPGKHKNIHAYCEEKGIKVVRQMLNVGDYMLAGPEYGGIKGDIAVDTKADVRELAMDLFQAHLRTRVQFERAQDYGIKLIVLIEEVLPGGKLVNWRSPLDRLGRPVCKFDPAVLRKVMITMQERYNVLFRFCDGRSTGRVLIEHLKGERSNE